MHQQGKLRQYVSALTVKPWG